MTERDWQALSGVGRDVTDASAEILRLKLRIRELGTALRNRQETFNRMLEQLQAREQEAVFMAGERAARTAAEGAARRLGFLAEASAVLSSSLDVSQTLSNVVRLAVPFVADLSVADLVQADGSLRQIALHHYDPARGRLVGEMRERFPARADARFGPAWVIRSRQSDVAFEIPDETYVAVAQNEEHLRLLRGLQLSSYIVTPLIANGEVLGALTVAYTDSGRHYTADDVALIEDLGRRAATAIQNARLVRGLEDAQTRLQDQAWELEAKSEEAQRARLAAEAASAAKSQFLAMMSHELRTPLNAIAGYGELLTMGVYGPINERQTEAIDRIRRSQQRLLSMINDLLNFARLEAGRVEFHIQDVPVAEVMANLEAIMTPQMQLKGLRFSFAECERLVVRGDREKLEQVLLNLLSNSVKFTDRGGSVQMYCEPGDGIVHMHVTDTGCGVPEGKLDRIFDPFIQVNPKLTGETEGIGLGLAISRDLARGMGGELHVTSTLGKGSTFTLTLPRVLGM